MHNDSFELIVRDTLTLLKGTPMPSPVIQKKEEGRGISTTEITETTEVEKKEEVIVTVVRPTIKPITLEPLQVAAAPSSSIEALIKKTAPQLKIYQEIPSDEKARRVKEGYKSQQNIPEIPLLYTDSKDRPFLNNVAKAIEAFYGSCHPIEMTPFEKERTWDFFLKTPHLKLILIPDVALWHSLDLLRYYKETPATASRTLGTLPLLLIADPKLYQTDPNLKRSLWHMIKNSLKSSSTTP